MESISKQNSKYSILTPKGWSDFSGIRRKVSEDTLTIHTKTLSLGCTPDHLLKNSNNDFIEAKKLNINDKLFNLETITDIKKRNKIEFVYDALDVDLDNEYYTNGFVSHNCQFLGSSGTLISGACLKTLSPMVPIVQHDGIRQYKLPQEGHNYVITADVSRGKGLDYSAFHVVDITKMPYDQVCTYRNNMVTPVDYAVEIHRISKLYNNATILIEINDIGGQVSDTLYYDYEADNLIFTENGGSKGKRISGGFGKNVDRGIRTTKVVKTTGCSILKLLVEQYQLIINDFDTIHELSRFSRKGTSYEAESGANDDLVMGLVLFAWLSDQQFFKDLTDINTLQKLRDKTDEQIEEDLVPFGFISDGQENHQSDVIDINTNPDDPMLRALML